MSLFFRPVLGLVALFVLHQPAAADIVSDWNEKVISFSLTRGLGPPGQDRLLAMTHLAMFDAVNAVERGYRPYLFDFVVTVPTSKEAAAAAAAASVLAGVDPSAAKELKLALATYLANIPDGEPKQNGIELGEAVAAKMLAWRADDGAQAPDTWRPRTLPGVYVPTAPVVTPHWPGVKPFALRSADQVRPGPPPALTRQVWADDYNEIKELGSRNSVKRSARQTEDARFWLAVDGRVYYPLVKTVAAKRNLNLLDSARLFALTTVARTDAGIAVFDAKYHYNFWRPVTAIRNGDIDDNPATERDPAWLPFDATPAHPEYPCAHCISSASIGGVVETAFSSANLPEVSIESPTLPGIPHRWTNLSDFYREVAEARICAGFHYRFSTKVGQDMGRKIGEYVVHSILQPIADRHIDTDLNGLNVRVWPKCEVLPGSGRICCWGRPDILRTSRNRRLTEVDVWLTARVITGMRSGPESRRRH